MRMRLTVPDAHTGWLLAGRSAAGAVLLAVTVTGCIGTGSGTPATVTPATQTPSTSVIHTGTRTPSPTGQGHSGTASARSSATSSGGTRTSAHASASASAHASGSAAAGSSASGRPSASHASSGSHTSSATHAATPHPTGTAAKRSAGTHTTRPFPTTAPETGGGGTAGLQDGLLFGVGGAAILAGLGTLAYRRRLSRRFSRRVDAGRPPADKPQGREPADR